MTYGQHFGFFRTLVQSMTGTLPTMTCIKPRSTWGSGTVPSGYSYDADYDKYVDSSGTVWDESSATLPSDTVEILPGGGLSALDLEAGGIVDTGDRFVRIQPGSLTTVQNAQWVVLDTFTYDIGEITAEPAGAALWYRVQLRKR